MVGAVELTAEIVSAFISNNSLPTSELPGLLQAVYGALSGAAGQGDVAAAEEPTPAISVRKSVTPDYIVCLEDGKRFKSLRRHLTLLGMTPEQYRAKWKLPPTYPMVAANYAAKRSELAKTIGLGRAKPEPAPSKPAAPRKPGRPRKSAP